MSDRRGKVPFDPYHFEQLRREGAALGMRDTFRRIYRSNHWRGDESASGEGASREQTAVLEAALPALLRAYDVEVMLDLPCGDFSWMQHVDLPVSTYIGADIVPELIAENQERFATVQRRFVTLDMTQDALPPADLLLCRDGLVHLSFADIFQAFRNIRSSPVRYLLATTFPACTQNEDITTGDWRVLNLEVAPFHLLPPMRLINERCTEGDGAFVDKSLGLWRVRDLPTG